MRRTGNRTSNIMLKVLAALVPGLLAQSYYLGPGVLVNGMVLTLCCLATEALIVVLRKPNNLRAELLRHLGDGTTLLIAWLIAVCLPPNVPVGVLAIAALASVGLAKHAYGGLGQNVFNPAMVGYAIILLSFPGILASYPSAHQMD